MGSKQSIWPHQASRTAGSIPGSSLSSYLNSGYTIECSKLLALLTPLSALQARATGDEGKGGGEEAAEAVAACRRADRSGESGECGESGSIPSSPLGSSLRPLGSHVTDSADPSRTTGSHVTDSADPSRIIVACVDLTPRASAAADAGLPSFAAPSRVAGSVSRGVSNGESLPPKPTELQSEPRALPTQPSDGRLCEQSTRGVNQTRTRRQQPNHATSRCVTLRHAASRCVTLRHAMSRHIALRHAMPRRVALRHTPMPHHVTSHAHAAPRHVKCPSADDARWLPPRRAIRHTRAAHSQLHSTRQFNSDTHQPHICTCERGTLAWCNRLAGGWRTTRCSSLSEIRSMEWVCSRPTRTKLAVGIPSAARSRM